MPNLALSFRVKQHEAFYEMNLRVLAGLMTSTWLAISAEFSMFVLTSTYSLPLCKPFKLVVWSAFNSRSRRTCLTEEMLQMLELFKLRRCVSAAVPGHVSNSPPLVLCRQWLTHPTDEYYGVNFVPQIYEFRFS